MKPLVDRVMSGEVKLYTEWNEHMTDAEQAAFWKQEYERSEHERDMEHRLKPCPFCGESVTVDAMEPSFTDGTYDAYAIRCNGCEFERYLETSDSDEVIETWNTRASATRNNTPPEPPEQLEQPQDRLLRRWDVAELTGIKSPSTFYDMIRRGSFPKPIKLGRNSAWRESEVRQWIADNPPFLSRNN